MIKPIAAVAVVLMFYYETSAQLPLRYALTAPLVSSEAGVNNAFPLVNTGKQAAPLCYDSGDYKGVVRAIGDLQTDIAKVTGVQPVLLPNTPPPALPVIIGTLGHSRLIDGLAKAGRLNTKDLTGKWESFVITTVTNPIPGVQQAMVIAGSDKRGTIYGIYELSAQLGVSPWYWWADVPVQQRNAAYITPGRFASGEPKVRYRGIFINDEAPCFTGWTKEKFGGRNSSMYKHMFELLLRLRANYLWPAMWSGAFNEDDPDNPRVADEYGIVMGTSHHEPLLRSAGEWNRHKKEFGNGRWNYVTNKQGIQQFWRQGLERNKNYESILTMGMRGDGDEPMPDAGSAQDNFRVLQNIMADQRKIVQEVTKKPASATPQLWALYSEVLEYYDQGMKVPDDMTILLCDDNWANVRRLPEQGAARHPGGYGIYYHVDLHGAPRAYQWLNMTQIPHMWEQLQLTYSYGVDKVWILNVGDLKPNEYPMDFFLQMAWNPERYNETNLDNYAQQFCAEQFGQQEAREAAELISLYCRYNSRVTAEMLNHTTYNLQSGEWLHVRDAYLALEARTMRQYLRLPAAYKDAYTELILHPIRAMANLYDMYYAVAMNRKLAAEKDPEANYWADHASSCFQRDAELSRDYNQNVAGGKWNHMMDQTHIGYTSWDEPRSGNIPPTLTRVAENEVKTGGYIFREKNGVVVMEATHYYSHTAGTNTRWAVIPGLGRTLAGIALLPYTQATTDAQLNYRFQLQPPAPADSITVRMIFKSTLPFKKGGHSMAAAMDNHPQQTWNINDQLTWKNNYSKMYPAGAARIIETHIKMPVNAVSDGVHTLAVRPLDPGIVLYKVIIDNGGYENTHLKMPESPYQKK